MAGCSLCFVSIQGTGVPQEKLSVDIVRIMRDVTNAEHISRRPSMRKPLVMISGAWDPSRNQAQLSWT